MRGSIYMSNKKSQLNGEVHAKCKARVKSPLKKAYTHFRNMISSSVLGLNKEHGLDVKPPVQLE